MNATFDMRQAEVPFFCFFFLVCLTNKVRMVLEVVIASVKRIYHLIFNACSWNNS